MSSIKKFKSSEWKTFILSCIWGPLLMGQIILVIFLGKANEAGLDLVFFTGWAIWVISVIFGFLPIFTFKRKGGVQKGESYVQKSGHSDGWW